VSVENRIFWLLVGILALYLVLSSGGRNAINTFLYSVFGFQLGGANAPPGVPDVRNKPPIYQGDGPNPDGTWPGGTTPPAAT
jgi:hypothetical protein